jgi:hypothetical protein
MSMKKALLVLAFASVSAFAAEFSGTISDSHCGAKHIAATQADAACAQKCLKGGADAVLVTSDSSVLKIDAASKDKVASFAGKKVTIKGTVSKGTLTVDSIE